MTDELLAEQLAYYRARAPEYDRSVGGRALSGPLLEALAQVAYGEHRAVRHLGVASFSAWAAYSGSYR